MTINVFGHPSQQRWNSRVKRFRGNSWPLQGVLAHQPASLWRDFRRAPTLFSIRMTDFEDFNFYQPQFGNCVKRVFVFSPVMRSARERGSREMPDFSGTPDGCHRPSFHAGRRCGLCGANPLKIPHQRRTPEEVPISVFGDSDNVCETIGAGVKLAPKPSLLPRQRSANSFPGSSLKVYGKTASVRGLVPAFSAGSSARSAEPLAPSTPLSRPQPPTAAAHFRARLAESAPQSHAAAS
jgi:hypothetical protein